MNVFGTSDSKYLYDSRCGMIDVAFRTAPTSWWAFLYYYIFGISCNVNFVRSYATSLSSSASCWTNCDQSNHFKWSWLQFNELTGIANCSLVYLNRFHFANIFCLFDCCVDPFTEMQLILCLSCSRCWRCSLDCYKLSLITQVVPADSDSIIKVETNVFSCRS